MNTKTLAMLAFALCMAEGAKAAKYEVPLFLSADNPISQSTLRVYGKGSDEN